MNSLIETIIKYFCFLYNTQGFKFYNSEVFNESEALIDLKNSRIHLSFIRERGDVFIEIASQQEPIAWYDFYLIIKYFLGERAKEYLLIQNKSAFLIEYYTQIEEIFSINNIGETKEKLDKLKLKSR